MMHRGRRLPVIRQRSVGTDRREREVPAGRRPPYIELLLGRAWKFLSRKVDLGQNSARCGQDRQQNYQNLQVPAPGGGNRGNLLVLPPGGEWAERLKYVVARSSFLFLSDGPHRSGHGF
jgi:hypothetical protein